MQRMAQLAFPKKSHLLAFLASVLNAYRKLGWIGDQQSGRKCSVPRSPVLRGNAKEMECHSCFDFFFGGDRKYLSLYALLFVK